MKFKDQIEFVKQHVKKNRMRIFTTVLATTMGCAFLIVLASVAFGLQGSMEDEILSDNRLTKIDMYSETEGQEINTNEIKKMENVVAAYKETSFENMTVEGKLDGSIGIPSVKSTDFSEMKNAKITLSEGVYPTEIDEVVVGYNLAENMLSAEDEKKIEEAKEGENPKVGIQNSILGKKIMLEWTEPEVEGTDKNVKKVTKEFVIAGVTTSLGSMQDTSFFMSDVAGDELTKEFEVAFGEKFNATTMLYSNYYAYASDLEKVKAINSTLKEQGYYTYTVSERLDEMNLIFLALKAGLIFIGTIAVLIASIGIFNTMTMAVSERTREIGVMKAIGASPKLIQRLFIMESAYIGILGTVIAIIISYIISIAANFIIPEILIMATNDGSLRDTKIIFSAIPWQLVVIAATISIGVAILSGWRPARKATKIDVINALKRE